MKPASKRHFDPVRLAPPLFFGALAIGYLSFSGGFSDPTSSQAPLLYGKILLGLSLTVFGLSLAGAFRGVARTPTDGPLNGIRAASIYLMLGGLIAAIFAFGFYVAIPLFLLLFFRFVGRLSFLMSLLGAFLSLLFVWLVFSLSLHMRVFPGYLAPYLGLG